MNILGWIKRTPGRAGLDRMWAERQSVLRSMEEPAPLRTAYLICSAPRSGSSLLCDALLRTGAAGYPEEWFRPEVGRALRPTAADPPFDDPGYLPTLLRRTTTPNGVAGAKVMWDDFARVLDGTQWHPAMLGADFRGSEALPGLAWLRMVRRDKGRQAVSLAIAQLTGAWHSVLGVEQPADKAAARAQLHAAAADPGRREAIRTALHRALGHIEACEAGWDGFFREHGIEPRVVEYEGMAADLDAAVRGILGWLGTGPRIRPDYAHQWRRKQADGLNRKLLALLREDGPAARASGGP